MLKDAKERYILAFNHYPAYSTGRMSRPGPDKKLPAPMQQSRDVILPLLARYKATAIFSACDYHYERNEVPAPQGVPQIVIGTGSKIYRISGRAGQVNPYSKVFGYTQAYAVLDAGPERCTLRVYNFEGLPIDERVFAPRPAAAP